MTGFVNVRAQTSRPIFRVGVDIVSLNVTVTDAARRARRGFEPRRLCGPGRGRRRTSSSGRPTFRLRSRCFSIRARHGAGAGERPGSRNPVSRASSAVRHADRLRQQSPFAHFTSDRSELEWFRTMAGGSTSLYNAVYVALKELSGSSWKTSCKVWGGGPSSCSRMGRHLQPRRYDELLDLASRSDTMIYWWARERRFFGKANIPGRAIRPPAFGARPAVARSSPRLRGDADGRYTARFAMSCRVNTFSTLESAARKMANGAGSMFASIGPM